MGLMIVGALLFIGGFSMGVVTLLLLAANRLEE